MKRRAYLGMASAPAIVSAALVLVTLAGLGGLLVHFAFGSSRNEALLTAVFGCIAALMVYGLQLIGKPRIACVLGVDGIEVKGFDARVFGHFVPWSEIGSVDHSGSEVLFHLKDKRTLVVTAWSRPLYLDAVALLRAFRGRKPVDETEGYRELDTDSKLLVRVVEDPRQDSLRRRAAFEKLDADEQASVLASLADPKAREALAEPRE